MEKFRRCLPLLIIAAALAARLVPGPRTIDDSYITYRYARNLLSGEGFVYNPGEHVQGTTTPLYTLLMAGLGLLAGGANAPFPWLSWGQNALADAATCFLLIKIGERAGSRTAGCAAALAWAVAPFSVTFAVGGLETSIYVLLLTGAAAAFAYGRHTALVLLSVLAVLTRPDAVLLAGPLVLQRLVLAVRGGQKIRLAEALCLLPAAAWGLFATLYFGSPIPHSVQAKLLAYHLEPGSSLMRVLQHYATPFLEQNWLGTLPAVAVGLVLYPFLFIVGARRALKAEPRLLAFFLYPWLYLAAFSLPNPLIFRWYLTPPLPAYFLGILLGAEQVWRSLLALPALKIPARARQALLAALLIVPALSSLGDWRLHPDHGSPSPAPGMAWIKLELLYRQAAEEIAAHMAPGERLAAGDVGVLGYFTGLPILDTVGLNSPVSLKYYPLDASSYVINYAVPAALILNEKPDWIVVLEVYARRTLLADPAFQEAYRLHREISTDIYGSQGMLIFRRAE